MAINSIQGPAAYANTLNTTPPVENTQLRGQNTQDTPAPAGEQSQGPAQNAFEVNITQEARDLLAGQNQQATAPVTLAAEGTPEPASPPPPPEPPAEPPPEASASPQDTTPVVDIVA